MKIKDACLPPASPKLRDKYPDSLKNWQIQTCVVATVSLQHFLWWVVRDFLKDLEQLPLAKKGRSIYPTLYELSTSPSLLFSLHLFSSDFGQLQEGRWWEKSVVLCMVFSLCIFVLGNKRGLTSRFPLLILHIACFIKNGGSLRYCVPKGNIQFLWILHITVQLSLQLTNICRGTCLG